MAVSRGKKAAQSPIFQDETVLAAFARIPELPRQRLLELRALIFEVAQSTPGVGQLEEALRWGEPTYLTPHTRSGTSIRIHWKAKRADCCAMYVHCQTSLLHQFRELHADVFEFEGKRALLFPVSKSLPRAALSDCIRLALTYHLSSFTLK